MRSLVTGAAGFIGSHLCQRLLALGDDVVAIDSITDYYDPRLKEANLERCLPHDRYRFVRADLRRAPLDSLLAGVDVVYHLAGQPGVRPSWGKDFGIYLEQNVDATQVLLEALRGRNIHKLVFASSSSVYGDAETYPTNESMTPQPISPYGVTKLAAEHLCHLYRKAWDVPTAALRLFTVYGPRQRPDMAFSKLVTSALAGEAFELYGDGEQTRDFTYVGDVVRAFTDAAASSWTGTANIGGGCRVTVNEVLSSMTKLCGDFPRISIAAQAGDVRHTAADTTVAREAFGYRPATSLEEGLQHMIDDRRAHHGDVRTPEFAASAAASAGSS